MLQTSSEKGSPCVLSLLVQIPSLIVLWLLVLPEAGGRQR